MQPAQALLGPTNPFPQRCATVLQVNQSPIFCVKWNAEGKYCLSGGADRAVHLWNPFKEGGSKYIASYKGAHGYEVLGIDVTPDSARIASVGGDRTAYTWDVRTGQVIGRYRGHTEKITCVSYFADGNLLVTGSADKTLRIWDTRMKHQKAQHHQQQQQQQAGGAAGGGGGSYVRERGGVCVQTMSDCVDSVSAVYANDNMGEIICSSIDGCIYSYDVRKGTKTVDHFGHSVTSFAVSRDAQCVLAQCTDSSLRLLDRSTGKLLNSYSGHKADTYAVQCAFSCDEAHVISGSEDGRISYWSLVDGTMECTLPSGPGGMQAPPTTWAAPPSSSSTSSSIASPSTSSASSASSSSSSESLVIHAKAVTCVAQHPTELTLLTASLDGRIAVWR